MAFDKELAGQFGEYMAKAGRLLDAEKYGEAIELYSRDHHRRPRHGRVR